jgi:hypothetical protein
VEINEGSTTNYVLSGLYSGIDYVIAVIAHSISFANQESLILDSPNIDTISVTSTSIYISWTLPQGSSVNSSEVVWLREETGQCSLDDEGSATFDDDSTNYTIVGVQEGSSYRVFVTVTNDQGINYVSNTIMPVTRETGLSQGLT